MGTTGHSGNSMNELIFENRNKTYGAYRLRQGYDDSLLKSFTIAMLTLLSLVGVYKFLSGRPIENGSPVIIRIDTTTMVTWKTKVDPPIAPPKPPSAPPRNPNPSLTPAFTDDSVRTVADTTRIETPVVNNATAGGPGIPGPDIDQGTGKPGIEIPEHPEPFEGPMVDQMPEFPGGEAELVEYLRSNIHYPREAINRDLSGRVILRFVVDATGSISKIETIHKIGGGCEEEAVRVVGKMPKWKPGKMGGKAVPVYFYLPVTYTLQ